MQCVPQFGISLSISVEYLMNNSSWWHVDGKVTLNLVWQRLREGPQLLQQSNSCGNSHNSPLRVRLAGLTVITFKIVPSNVDANIRGSENMSNTVGAVRTHDSYIGDSEDTRRIHRLQWVYDAYISGSEDTTHIYATVMAHNACIGDSEDTRRIHKRQWGYDAYIGESEDTRSTHRWQWGYRTHT